MQQPTRADRAAAAGRTPGRWPRWSRTPSSPRRGAGSGRPAAGARRRRGCRSWSRSGTAGCWSRRSPSTAAPRCRWPPTWRRRPTSGLRVQLCGDAHLSNFGAFASPERRLVFDRQRLRRDAARARSSGTSSGWPPASPSPAGTTAFSARTRRKIVLAAVAGYRHGDARVRRRSRCWTSGTPTSTSRRRCRRSGPSSRPTSYKPSRGDAGQGAHPRQHAGAEQADHGRRRAAPDHQRPAADRAGRGALQRRARPTRSTTQIGAADRASTAAPCSPTGGTCWSSSPWSRWPARSSGSAASAPAPGSC